MPPCPCQAPSTDGPQALPSNHLWQLAWPPPRMNRSSRRGPQEVAATGGTGGSNGLSTWRIRRRQTAQYGKPSARIVQSNSGR